MEPTKKREIPTYLRSILQTDIALTKKFNALACKTFPIHNWSTYFKALEISCHGIPWFAFWICFTWLFNKSSLVQMQINMLLGLFLDIIMVALLKAYTRRKRPSANTDDALGQMGPDVFSFPSGHASRAVFVAYFFVNLHPLCCFFAYLFFIIWATAVCITRILMNRHHILDVIAGVLLGIFNGILVGLLYLSEDSSQWLLNFFSDENVSGADYHV